MEAERDDPPACPGCARRDRRIAALEARLKDLEQKIHELAGAAKRQAAPFSKGPPKADPKPPGRKGGDDYGTKGRRQIPPRIDKVYQAPLPGSCPHCGGTELLPGPVLRQYQVELPREPLHRRFDIATGRCRRCRRTLRGRHPLQTSDATGACASQLGPDAQAAAVLLNKELGLSHGKVSRFFNALFGIDLTPGGVCHAVLRAARKGHVVYDAAIDHLRRQEQVSIDDTGWKVAGHAASLHAAAGSAVTAYLVHPRRNWQAIAKLLGVTYDQTLVHDGYRAYDFFAHCRHQSCLAHLLVRCKRMLLVAKGHPRRFPRAVRALLKEALALRDAQRAGVFTIQETAFESLDLRRRMAALVRGRKKDPENRRLARHLTRLLQMDQLFLFLREADTDATNHKAEQAIRPAVVNRKVWGGNRTWNGAMAQSVLMSILRTAAARRGHDVLQTVSRMLCEARPHRRAALLFPDSS
jgi:transposase